MLKFALLTLAFLIPAVASAQSVKEYTFTLTIQESAVLAAALRKAPMPYEITAPVIDKMQKQANEQVEKSAPKPADPEPPK